MSRRALVIGGGMLVVLAACGPTSVEGPTTTAEVSATVSTPTTIETEPSVPPEEVELVVWHQFSEGAQKDAWDDVKAAFLAENPHVTISDTAFSIEDMLPAVTTGLPAGAGPDVAFFDASSAHLGSVAEAGLALDLTPYFEQRGWDDVMFPWVVDVGTYGGKKYGIGGNPEVVGLYYNADLFAELGLAEPTTWDALIAAADAAKEAGLTPFAHGDLEGWPASHFCGALVHAFASVDLIGEVELLDGSMTWRDAPEMIEGAGVCQEWATDSGYMSSDVVATSTFDALQDFVAGRALMRIDGSWSAADIGESAATMRFMPLPTNGIPPQAEGGLSSTWFVNAQTQHVDAAIDFVDFAVFSDQSVTSFLQAGALPSWSVDVEVDLAPLVSDVIAAIETVSVNGAGLGYWIGFMADATVIEAANAAWQELLVGRLTPEEFAEKMSVAMETARESRGTG